MPGLPSSNDGIIAGFDEMTRNAVDVQNQVLKSILQQNSGTEYLQQFGLHGRTDPETFKRCVPVISHSDIQPLIQRIADGDKSPILTTEPIQTLCLSSGTTNGCRKFMPLYAELLESTVQLARLSAAYRERAYPLRPGGRILEFAFSGRVFNTKGGVLAGTALTHLFRSKEFKLRQETTRSHACSPKEVVLCLDSDQSMYCYLLCGLLYREEVEFLSSTFAYALVEAFRRFEVFWPDICNDIRSGKLNARINDPSVRAAIAKILQPSPQLADAISEICNGLDKFYGVIQTLWPNCKYLYTITTGSMQAYIKRLQHYAGDLPLVSGDYGASECWIGLNTNPKSRPENVSFTVVPSFCYVEFIPLRRCQTTGEELEPVDIAGVEIGHEYEIVVTTYGGFYRYRLGDIVKVTGKYNNSPQLAYVCRKNVLLNIHIDKNTEKDLLIVVEKASNLLREVEVELVDFTSYADLSTTPGHYVVFWELRSMSGGLLDEGVLERCASLMDASFVDPGYTGSRSAGTIGPLELCVVEPGTFRQQLLDQYLEGNATAISQYKTPRCLASSAAFRNLKAHTWRSFFSSAL